MLLSNSVHAYHGRIFRVSWDAAIGLRDLGAEFILLIASTEQQGSQLQTTVENFFRFNAINMYATLVLLNNDAKAAGYLGVSLLPQIRLYRNGSEVRRIHGIASYETLQQLIS